MKYAIQFLIMISLFFVLFGCGKKALPVPPHQVLPPAINNLTSNINKDTLKLTWTIPEQKEKVESSPAGFIVYKSKKPLSKSKCLNCPVLFKRIADVPIKTGSSKNLQEKIMAYNEILEKGYRYVYKVIVYADNGATGDDSNRIDFVY